MKILFLGDIVGKSGRNAVLQRLPFLQQAYDIDFTIINAENSAHGKGITTKIYQSLKDAGVDVITLGNHAYSKREIMDQFDHCPDLIRPENMDPAETGRGYVVRECRGKRIAVINLLGTIFMDQAAESPITVMQRLLKEIEAEIIIVDLHAEATGEKEIFFHIFKDQVTAVFGTHTHVQTADEQILDGCAYITDAGMCGTFQSILGRSVEEVLARTLNSEKTHFVPADGPAVICGCVVEIDDQTNRAVNITRIMERPAE